MQYKKPVLFAIIFTIALSLLSCKKSEKEGDKKKPIVEKDAGSILRIEIITDSKNYSVSDEIALSFKIINVSDETVNLNVTAMSKISDHMKIGWKSGESVSYSKGSVARLIDENLVMGKSLIALEPSGGVGGVMFFRINPIRRITEVPYDAGGVFVELDISDDAYPKNIEAFYKRVTGSFRSNEVPVEIDAAGYEDKYEQFEDTGYEIRYYKLTTKNTDLLILQGFDFDPAMETDAQSAAKMNAHVKVFRNRDSRNVLFEFYIMKRLVKYARLLYDTNGKMTDFIIYNGNGLIDMRYEPQRDSGGRVSRWDKFTVGFIEKKDYYLGYIKILKYGDNNRISEILANSYADNYVKYTYDEKGKQASREETAAPLPRERERKY